MVERAKRIALLIVGIIALGLGGLGVVLPLVPTTPFILVAAFAFAGSSEKLHQWLLDHELFGSLIANWRSHGAISRKTKIVSILAMVAVVGISLVLGIPDHAIIIQIVILSAAAFFVLSRPAPPDQ